MPASESFLKDMAVGDGETNEPDCLEPDSLSSMAAVEAAKILCENWETATGEGFDLESLLHDVDDAIEHLRRWKSLIQKRLPYPARQIMES